MDGRIALVTGASRGIGRAIALELASRGAGVIGTATTEEGSERISNYLKENGYSGTGRCLDVASPESVSALLEWLAAEGQTPTILVNNAGIARDNLLLRMRDEEWDEVIATNLTSIYRLCRGLLKGMMKARHGRIINITSVVALSGNPGQTNYAASKAGMIGFTKSLAREVGSRNITVNAVAPGFIESDMTRALPENQRQGLLGQIPLRRLGEAEEVAKAVAFLASEDGAYITGETLNVNGGMYMP
ncbi:MAG: 3-oxoacyl-ACP reductase FabG [Gammaproteobacteria bacterium]|nr:MAG: 3-oxoacyl-ACP reductase FabG [Gammaproteobacteria bacterium]